ncbi:hypothetical protein HK098_005497 [Nowakowskiella sp. JEL0407]|nr:hypothetical protein HK098_005497 [Nowakowskiella sp. JEL0407]
MSTDTEETSSQIYIPAVSEPIRTQLVSDTTDPSDLTQQAGSYAVYYPQQAMPIQQYAHFYPNQQYAQYDQSGAQTIDPSTGQPTQFSAGLATAQSSTTTATTPSRRSRGIQDSGPYFRETDQIHRIFSMDRQRTYKLRLFPKIDRGFFLAENDWTCYRRNYFQVSCSFTALDAANQRLDLPCYLQSETGWWTVTQFLINISSKTSTNTREIELVQHTAKRDKGPQLTPQPRACDPQVTPILNFRQDPESRAVVTFERLQFKYATANNGKRRAAQQYHVIVLELYGRCDNGTLIKIAQSESAPLVVRGRAPGHYAQITAKSAAAAAAYDASLFHHGDITAVQNPEALLANGQVLTTINGGQVYYDSNTNQYYQYEYPQQTQQYQYASQHFETDGNAWGFARNEEDVKTQDGPPAQLDVNQHDPVVNSFAEKVGTAELNGTAEVVQVAQEAEPANDSVKAQVE